MCMRKNRCNYILICVFALFLAAASTASAQVNWDSYYVYTLGNGANIGLAEGVTATYTTAANEITHVTFTDLNVNNVGAVNLGISYNSVPDAELRLINVDINGWMNYTVTHAGTQTFYIHSLPVSVIIDDEEKNRWTGDWSYSNGILTVNTALTNVELLMSTQAADIEREKAFDTFVTYIFLAVFLLGFVPLMLVIMLFRKGTLDPKMVSAVIFTIIIIVILALICLLFLSGVQNSF